MTARQPSPRTPDTQKSASTAASRVGADKRAAERVLRLAAEAMGALADHIDEGFSQALDLIQSASGRVVVTGMGKSGHVGRKIAATLSSTGTPSLFVHPAEASHGDMGMITQGDVVIALSNSGETAELNHVVAYTRRFAIPLIAMTRGQDSALAEAADHVLRLPMLPEACPMGLAPTTSTTAMLALGDAIAVALLERRGFNAQDFQLLHPGGSLGRKLKRVCDIMHDGDEMPLLIGDPSMAEAILVMTERRFGCVGLLDLDGRLDGIVTDGDLRRHMTNGLLERPARDVMTRWPVTIRPNALAAEALGLMNAKAITTLFAVDQDRPVGIIHIHDCLQAGVD